MYIYICIYICIYIYIYIYTYGAPLEVRVPGATRSPAETSRGGETAPT